MVYDLKPVKAPRAAGFKLKVLVGLAANPLTGGLLAGTLLKSAGVAELREVEARESPLFVPAAAAAGLAEELAGKGDPLAAATGLPGPGSGFPFETAADFTRAYLEGRATPAQVAERFLAAVKQADVDQPPLRTFIAVKDQDVLAQAEASTRRYREGKPLGPLDGVPVAVKDELDVAGYPTTLGTSFLGDRDATEDCEAVARLRAAGALVLGKTNMHEIGIGVTGVNPNHGAARNPYDPTCVTGGSSSGTAAAVAAGFCPLAVGADGGGSIRIPSSFCGVVGLKATFGRISEHGVPPLCWTVTHVGPIGASLRDVALGYAVMAGPDPRDPTSLSQPGVHVPSEAPADLKGLKIGIFEDWFNDADPEVVARCRALVDHFVALGARLVQVEIPDLALARTSHLVTIVSEMAESQAVHMKTRLGDYGLDTQMNLILGSRLKAGDYVHAQRLRNRVRVNFDKVLSQVDLLVTPTTACTAPKIPEDGLKTGESNLGLITRIMLYAQAANLTGLPGISIPAGYDSQGLPVGLQLMTRAFEEHRLLEVALVAEAFVKRTPASRRARLLQGS